MTNLVLDSSNQTPYFNLDQEGEFKFGGISMPEDAASFYRKIIDWIQDYYREPKKETFVTVGFRYINSSSSNMIFKLFKALKNMQDSGKTNVKCTWYYEEDDEDMKEYIEQIATHADNIEFDVYPTNDIKVFQLN